MQNNVPDLSPRYTKEMLRRCTPREILVMVATYGPLTIAQRMNYKDVEEFIVENTKKK